MECALDDRLTQAMPDRVLRAGLLTSERYDELPAEARDLFVRLLLIADDYGRFDGRPAVIASYAFGLGTGNAQAVENALQVLCNHDMVQRYTVNGKPYIAVNRWRERLRGFPRFPAPPKPNEFSREESKVGLSATRRNSLTYRRKSRAGSREPPASSGEVQASCGESQANCRLDGDGDGDECGDGDGNADVRRARAREAGDGAAAPPTTTSPTSGNGLRFNNATARFDGITEAQELRWQSAFPGLAVPVEIERAAAWLASRPAEVPAPELTEAFVVRWLLRSAK